MSDVRDLFQDFQGIHLVNVLASAAFLLAGLYSLVAHSSSFGLVIGVVLSIIGLLGLYNQFFGEPVTESLKNHF
jgi:hypothetical protein